MASADRLEPKPSVTSQIPPAIREALTADGTDYQGTLELRRKGLKSLIRWINEGGAKKEERANMALVFMNTDPGVSTFQMNGGSVNIPEFQTELRAAVESTRSRATSDAKSSDGGVNVATTNSPGITTAEETSNKPASSEATTEADAGGSSTTPDVSADSTSSGGGGGTPAPSSSTAPDSAPDDGGPSEDATDEELEAYIRENYGYMAWALDHEELGKVLRLAIKERWTAQKLEAELRTTDWWRENEASARNFDRLLGEDPASVEADIKTMELEIRLFAGQLGVDISPERMRQLATDAIRYGWQPGGNEFRSAIISEAQFNPEAGGLQAGEIGATQLDFKDLARQYYVQVSDEKAYEWALKVQEGVASKHDYEVYLRQQALSRFPHLKTYMDMGITPDMFFEPYKNTIASMLEMPAGQVDLMMDPRFAPVIDWVDEGGTSRPMRLHELSDYIRTLPEWQETDSAMQQASDLTTQLLSTFGAI